MNNVATPSAKYKEQSKKRYLPRALFGGTTKMREEGQEFLPKHPAESDASYEVRLNSTTLYNGFKDTINNTVGKVFSQSIIINDDVPQKIVEILDNVDGQGRDLTAFSVDVLRDAMIDGVSFILADFPVITSDGQLPTMADQMAQGAMPYLVKVCADDLIGWKSESIGGKQVLTEVRIKERVSEPDPKDPWSEVMVDQIRVIRIGSFELWRRENDILDSKWYIHSEGLTSSPTIPLVAVYSNMTGFFEGEPPLMPLAELNLEHWVSSSEQRKSLTYARFAMLVLTGVDGNSAVDVGPDKVLKLPQGGSAGYVESTGAGIEAGRLDLEAIEERMQHAGMTIRVQSTQGVTATAAAIDSSESDSALMATAIALQDSLNIVLWLIAQYLSIPDGGTVSMNMAFAQRQPEGTTQDLSTLYVAGLISSRTVLKELKRRNILDENLDIEAELTNLSNVGPIV